MTDPNTPTITIINLGYAPAAAQVLRKAGFNVRLVDKTKSGDIYELLSAQHMGFVDRAKAAVKAWALCKAGGEHTQ